MVAPKLIFTNNQFTELISTDSITTDILVYIKSYPECIPSYITMIGVSRNVAIGVFGIIKRDEEYYCRRICLSNESLIISDTEYPVSNMGNTPYKIEFNIDYILYMRLFKIIQNKAQ